MRKLLPLIALLLTMAVVSCESDDTALDQLMSQIDTVGLRTVALDTTPLTGEVEDIPASMSHPAYNDYIEHSRMNRYVYVTFTDSTVRLTGATARVRCIVQGAHLTVRSTAKRMHYVLSGSSRNGSFKLYGLHKAAITLNGLQLTNPRGAAINNQCHKTLYCVVAPGTANTLADGPAYDDAVGEDMKGAFFSEGQICFSGTGRLTVVATGRNGIASDDYLRFRPGGNIAVSSTAHHGVRANDGIFIDGGVLNIQVSGAGAKGMNCASHIAIAGGRTTIITSGGPRVQGADTTACAALKCDSTLTMAGGSLRLLSTGEGGKGLNAGGNIDFTGGDLTAVATGPRGLASPKGVKCGGNVTLAGGSFYAFSVRAEALDLAGNLTTAPGCKRLTRSHRYFLAQY